MITIIKFNIKNILKSKGITITQMAKDIGVSRQSLSAIVNNSISLLQIETLEKISNYLNVPVNRLISDDQTNYSAKASIKIEKVRIINKNELLFEMKLTVNNNNSFNHNRLDEDLIYAHISLIDTSTLYMKIDYYNSPASSEDKKQYQTTSELSLSEVAMKTPYSNYQFINNLFNNLIRFALEKSINNRKFDDNNIIKEISTLIKDKSSIKVITVSDSFAYWSFMFRASYTSNEMEFSMLNYSFFLTIKDDDDSIIYDIE